MASGVALKTHADTNKLPFNRRTLHTCSTNSAVNRLNTTKSRELEFVQSIVFEGNGKVKQQCHEVESINPPRQTAVLRSSSAGGVPPNATNAASQLHQTFIFLNPHHWLIPTLNRRPKEKRHHPHPFPSLQKKQ